MSVNTWKSICSNQDMDIVYACSYQGGIFKSENGGQSFFVIYQDFTTVSKFFSISCDNTGDYVICGCDGSYVLCSTNGGVSFSPLQLNETAFDIIVVNTNPYAEINATDILKFVCSPTGQLLWFVYFDGTSFIKHEQNIGYSMGSISITNNYIVIFSKVSPIIETYAYPLSLDAGVSTSISSITGISYAEGRFIQCNENYVFAYGFVSSSNQYEIWLMSITNLSNMIVILSFNNVQYLTISQSNELYALNYYSSPYNLTKYYDFNFGDKSYLQMNIYALTGNVKTFIYTNPYKAIETNQPLFMFDTGGDIFYSDYTNNVLSFIESFVSCFLENTNIRILKNNEIIEEKIQNLKINDEIVISNGETRKIIFIGYSHIHKTKIENIAKIKKDVLGLNQPYEDLYVITGHSLLFKEIPEHIKNEHYNEAIYNTTVYDGYKKIIALHTTIYETPQLEELNVIDDRIKYYHIALENNNEDEHYAIFSNGILTESMTVNYSKICNMKPL